MASEMIGSIKRCISTIIIQLELKAAVLISIFIPRDLAASPLADRAESVPKVTSASGDLAILFFHTLLFTRLSVFQNHSHHPR